MQDYNQSMLSAATQSCRTPTTSLSPSAQATLEKHLPGLPSKRLLQQLKIKTCDVGCVTGECLLIICMLMTT